MVDFQKSIEQFHKNSIEIIGASIDPIEEAQKTVQKCELQFPLGYNLKAENFCRQTGAFYDLDRGYLQGAGFIVRPNGIVANAVYATGPIGRYTASECLGMIDYYKKAKIWK